MEILKEKDGFVFDELDLTIGQARKTINSWKNKIFND